jgi:arylformamidase
MPKIYDISPTVGAGLAVWPRDTSLEREVLLDMKRGDNLTLSTLRSTVHLGAHADAPSHYSRDAGGITTVPLERYLGPCQVIGVDVARGGRLTLDDVEAPVTQPRVLFRTGTYPDPGRFNEDFAALAPRLVDDLADQGVFLVGTDCPSVDPYSSKDLPAHQRLLARGVSNLEGLVLNDVPDGEYELIALPLKLEGFDASPVRAILRELPRSP